MPDANGVPTWQDFMDFYDNPIIKTLSTKEKWTVSTTKDDVEGVKVKVPIDMRAFIDSGKVIWLKFNKGYNPMVTLPDLCEALPTAKTNAFWLDSSVDEIIVLDIEPKCPDVLKQRMLNLPFLYGEVSMSGQGYHLIFKLPKEILNKYPNAAKKVVLKPKNGYYEIMLNHMITFTRNVIKPCANPLPIEEFYNMFELLASEAKTETYKRTGGDVDYTGKELEEVPHCDEFLSELSKLKYSKTLEDFPQEGNRTGYDHSAYEFGMASFYYYAILRLLNTDTFKKITLTNEDKALLITECLVKNLDHRPKHDTRRGGLPWLMDVAINVIKKS